MTNNTQQLPAEVIEKIKDDAETYAGVMVWVNKHPAGDEQFFYEYIAATSHEAGATEYAIELQQVKQENKELKQWKAESSALLNPILDYGQSKEAGIPLGESITAVVLERCKQYDTARTLLEKFISRHEAGLLPDRFIYEEIKTFLDGTK